MHKIFDLIPPNSPQLLTASLLARMILNFKINKLKKNRFMTKQQ